MLTPLKGCQRRPKTLFPACWSKRRGIVYCLSLIDHSDGDHPSVCYQDQAGASLSLDQFCPRFLSLLCLWNKKGSRERDEGNKNKQTTRSIKSRQSFRKDHIHKLVLGKLSSYHFNRLMLNKSWDMQMLSLRIKARKPHLLIMKTYLVFSRHIKVMGGAMEFSNRDSDIKK